MNDKRTIVINLAIDINKAVSHMTIATQLLDSVAGRLIDLDNEIRKPTLQVVNTIADALAKGVEDE